MRHAKAEQPRASAEASAVQVHYPWHLISCLEQRRREQRQRVEQTGNDLNPRLVELFARIRGQINHSN
ncbi:MAG TPA: hypothetical protein VEL07_15680 [Planctomycetota bacterium]|nr:hypothetical protein [Planctomycetota bacterium]